MFQLLRSALLKTKTLSDYKEKSIEYKLNWDFEFQEKLGETVKDFR